ncbi:MAG: histidine phosphatase family protein, partial [Rhizobacter sp.]|nr:histidine phosphatase family protein [Rhizobacter sp.]
MAQLTIIRHGQASFGADDYDKLSATGARQSDLLGRWLAACGFIPARVALGSLLRQRETADHCLAALSAEGTAQRVTTRVTIKALDEYDNEEILHVHLPHLATPSARREYLATHADPVRAS